MDRARKGCQKLSKVQKSFGQQEVASSLSFVCLLSSFSVYNKMDVPKANLTEKYYSVCQTCCHNMERLNCKFNLQQQCGCSTVASELDPNYVHNDSKIEQITELQGELIAPNRFDFTHLINHA